MGRLGDMAPDRVPVRVPLDSVPALRPGRGTPRWPSARGGFTQTQEYLSKHLLSLVSRVLPRHDTITPIAGYYSWHRTAETKPVQGMRNKAPRPAHQWGPSCLPLFLGVLQSPSPANPLPPSASPGDLTGGDAAPPYIRTLHPSGLGLRQSPPSPSPSAAACRGSCFLGRAPGLASRPPLLSRSADGRSLPTTKQPGPPRHQGASGRETRVD